MALSPVNPSQNNAQVDLGDLSYLSDGVEVRTSSAANSVFSENPPSPIAEMPPSIAFLVEAFLAEDLLQGGNQASDMASFLVNSPQNSWQFDTADPYLRGGVEAQHTSEDSSSLALQVEESLIHAHPANLPRESILQYPPLQEYQTFDWPQIRPSTNAPELGNVLPEQEGANRKRRYMSDDPLNTQVRKRRPPVSTCPALMKYWNKRNMLLDPNKLTTGSNQDVLWQCDKYDTHWWLTSVALQHRTVVSDDSKGCPFCRNETDPSLPPLSKSELMREWDHVTNSQNRLLPEQFTIGSKMRVWWKCSINPDHPAWQARILDRAKGLIGCRKCQG